MKNVSIYTTTTCTYCKQAKDLFKEKGIQYNEYDVGADAEKRKEMIEKTGQMGVPVITIGDDVMVGFDRVAVLEALGM